MQRQRLALWVVAGIGLTCGTKVLGDDPRAGGKYPEAPRSETVDVYHRTRVADRYRKLEDPDSPETRAWIAAENRETFGFLESIPRRAAIKSRLTELWDFEKFEPPTHEGGRYFFTYNTGLQNQSVLYTSASIVGEASVVIDPNTLSQDGTVALSGTKVSHDGRFVAYGIAAAGSDWSEWKVRDLAAGKDLPDKVKWIKFSRAAWAKDDGGFFYGRFPEPASGQGLNGANYDQQVFYHRLGTNQQDDVLVWEDRDHEGLASDPDCHR
jgi:prolyl oligopeptidase